MKLLIVPDYVREAINRSLDDALYAACQKHLTEIPVVDRDRLFDQMLLEVDKTGEVPSITIHRIGSEPQEAA